MGIDRLDYPFNRMPVSTGLVALLLFLSTPALAQAGAPLPGGGEADNVVQPTPAANQVVAAPVPGQLGMHAAVSSYRDLPLAYDDAKQTVKTLRSKLASSRPQDLRDKVNHLSEWLADIADAHYRMSLTFAKSDSTKAQSLSEKQQALKFSALKHEAELLKADLLIKEQRYPEALGPLVNIVVAEPNSATGQGAYKRLKEMGFSQDMTADPSAAVAPAALQTKEPTPAKAVQAPVQPVATKQKVMKVGGRVAHRTVSTR